MHEQLRCMHIWVPIYLYLELPAHSATMDSIGNKPLLKQLLLALLEQEPVLPAAAR